jgi:predicted AlkP superfamily phosphohydrolase/phosphomutase
MTESRARVVLVAIDGLSWNLLRSFVDQGLLPTFERLLKHGLSSDLEVASAVPGLDRVEKGLISPVLWTTAATGQYYFRHGIYDFFDFITNIEHPPLFGSQDVKAPRIWDILSAYQMESLVVGYYITHPATPLKGCMVSDLFGEVVSSEAVFPKMLADRLAQMLGATDYLSYARQNRLSESLLTKSVSSPRWSEQVQLFDSSWISEIETLLHQFTRLAQTEIDDFMSPARSQEEEITKSLLWYRLIYPFYRDQRFHRLFMTLLEEYPDARFAAIYYRMIDFVSHGFWVEGTGVDDDFYQAYRPVLTQTYRLMDQYLADIEAKLGDDDLLLILSDHGFVGATSLPVISSDLQNLLEYRLAEHEAPGVFIAQGKSVASEVEHPISILDVTPSILDFFELPQAKIFDGGPVPGLLHPEAPHNIPMLENYPVSLSQGRQGDISPEEEAEILKRLAALGYIEA